ncbi:galactokinase [soil metagenome]
MTDLAATTAAGFRRAFGTDPTGVWSAPGRVNLIGEHTDYNEGFVLPFAIDRRTTVAVRLREDGIARVSSTFAEEPVELPVADLSPAALDGWSAYPLGVAWALAAQSTGSTPGFDAFIDSDVPVGAGLSSSAAIESSIAVALDELWSTGLDRPALASIGRLAENEAVGAPTGIMDQSASLLGRADSAVFLDCRSLESRIVPLGFAPHDLVVLIMDTRVKHAHVSGGYTARRESCELGARMLGVRALRDVSIADLAGAEQMLDDVTFRRVRHIVTENQRVLDSVDALESGDLESLGDLLVASHASMRDDFEISTVELDLAVSAALESGAIGARMTGGGFGGAAIALVDKSSVTATAEAVTAAFAKNGFAEPDLFVVTASDGAHRE